MRIYPENKRSKEALKGVYGIIMILPIFTCYALYGLANKNILFIASGFIILFLGLILSALLMIRASRTFIWSVGGVLEVCGGVVVIYHDAPFVYRIADLGETLFIPLDMGPITVRETLRAAVRGIILTYRVECVAKVCELQQYYDVFLRECGGTVRAPVPDRVVREAISLLFLTELDEFIRLCHGYSDEDPLVQAAYINSVTQYRVREFLKESLARYGLTLAAARTWCSVDPYTVE